MNNIIIVDLILLVAFSAWVFYFIKSRKHNLKREGWMYLYRTQAGVNSIEKFTKKFSGLLNFLKWPIIVVGFVLMIAILYLLIQTVWIYVSFPQITQVIKAPPVMPLIPYFPQLFGVESLMPPFYFTYFILALAVVAIVHEFAHGIYMRLYKVKIKSTGLVFLGPILGAFVEQDDKQLKKIKNSQQMAVLAAGVFANIVFTLLFFFLLVGFFNLAYQPAGYVFNDYAYNVVNIGDITGVGNSSLENLTEIYTIDNKTYYSTQDYFSVSQAIKEKEFSALSLYLDSPAIVVGLSGIITQINEEKIFNREDLSNSLDGKNPGELVQIKTFDADTKEEKTFELILGEHPLDKEKSFLGVSSSDTSSSNGIRKLLSYFFNFKDTSTYYEEKYFPNSTEYVYNLLWWIMMINFFVALFNMLPLGILDGGRFFYLTTLSLTKSKSFSQKSFKLISKLIGLIFILMILVWILAL